MFKDWLKVHTFWGFGALVLITITIANLLKEGKTTIQLAKDAEDTFVSSIRALRL